MFRLTSRTLTPRLTSSLRLKSTLESVQDAAKTTIDKTKNAASSAGETAREVVGQQEQATSNLKTTGVKPASTKGDQDVEPGVLKPGEGSPSFEAKKQTPGPSSSSTSPRS